MSTTPTPVPASAIPAMQAALSRPLMNKRGAVAVNSVLHVMRETGRTHFTDTDFQAMFNIYDTMNYLASDEPTEDSIREVPAGSRQEEFTGPPKPRLAAVQDVLTASSIAAE